MKTETQMTGIRGHGYFLSNNPEVRKVTRNRGVEYRDGCIIFDPYSIVDVQIESMSTNRDVNFRTADRIISQSPRLIRGLGIEASDQSVGVTPNDVRSWRRMKKLTWHEKEDLRTMQLVLQLIHDNHPHLAGVGEIKAARQRIKEEIARWER